MKEKNSRDMIYPLIVAAVRSLTANRAVVTILILLTFTSIESFGQLSYSVIWQSSSGVTQNAGALTKTVSTGWGNAGANSSNLLRPAQDGWLEFQVSNTSSRFAVGFSTNIGSYGYQDINYGINPNEAGQFQILESGSLLPIGAYQSGDVFRIAREGGQVKYYQNGTLIRTTTASTDIQMIVKAVIYSGQSPAVVSSFAPLPAETDPVWTNDKGSYYTRASLNASGQSQVHWGNLTNIPAALSDGDNQTLSVAGNQLSISGGNSVALPAWALGGNTGVNPATDFIGTLDSKDLVFKRANVEAGRLGASNTSFGVGALKNNGTGTLNTAVGTESLYSNVDGLYNTAIGNHALYYNTSGSQNTATGNEALSSNRTGAQNTATGVDALRRNVSGSWNTASGARALLENTTGEQNTANGFESLAVNTTGSTNTALGSLSLRSNTSGSHNTATGHTALLSNTIGEYNTANGYESLSSNTSGDFNTAMGAGSLYSNTEGVYNTATGNQALFLNTTGSQNTATGNAALSSNTIGSQNTATGVDALRNNSTGSWNVASGTRALAENTTGDGNTANGYSSLLLNTTGSLNTAMGMQSLTSNTSGTSNTASGYRALYLNTTGDWNTATGGSALLSNTIGTYNTANGANSLYSNTTGSRNTAMGADALKSNSSGSYNTASGNGSLWANTTGDYNTATGHDALRNNTTGSENVANGSLALYSNSSGIGNTANGNRSLFSNTTGKNNTANGNDALYRNTTGSDNVANGTLALYNNTFGTQNTANGIASLYSNTTGYENIATGNRALFANSYGSRNSASGSYALYNNTTGYGNTAVGYAALLENVSGNFNTSVGFGSGSTWYNSAILTNITTIGYNAVATASNQVRLGNTDVLSIGGYQSWSTLSDGRFKKNIEENVPGLEFIENLRPVSYEIDKQKLNTFLGIDDKNTSIAQLSSAQNQSGQQSATVSTPDNAGARQKPSRVIGFVAQEVARLVEDKGYEFPGVEKPVNEEQDHYSIRYADFVVPLTKAIQELSAIVKDQQKEIDELKHQLAGNQNNPVINDLGHGDDETLRKNGFELHQNTPNPFSQSTKIAVVLPDNVRAASIVLYDLQGKELRTYALERRGSTSIEIGAGEMQPGLYIYALIADGQLIASKRMLVIK